MSITGTSNTRARDSAFSYFGCRSPRSHLLNVVCAMPAAAARASWLQPFAFRRFLITSPIRFACVYSPLFRIFRNS